MRQAYIDEYFKKIYRGSNYIERVWKRPAEGICDDLLHRRRYLPDIHSPTQHPTGDGKDGRQYSSPGDSRGCDQGFDDSHPESD